jgi:hypothetical protein
VDFVVAAEPESYSSVVEALNRRGFRRGSAVGGEPGAVPDLELFRDSSGRRISNTRERGAAHMPDRINDPSAMQRGHHHYGQGLRDIAIIAD